jgi:APA family basic amino acid/polyamine antiporter
LISLRFPAALSSAPGDGQGGYINLPAFMITTLMSVILCYGIKESSIVNIIIVGVKVTVLLIFIFVGVGYCNLDNYTPFIPENTGTVGQFGWSGVFRGAGKIFFAYIGFDAVSTVAQEAKNPQRDMPIGILASLGICTILYIAVALVLVGMVPYAQLTGFLLI